MSNAVFHQLQKLTPLPPLPSSCWFTLPTDESEDLEAFWEACTAGGFSSCGLRCLSTTSIPLFRLSTNQMSHLADVWTWTSCRLPDSMAAFPARWSTYLARAYAIRDWRTIANVCYVAVNTDNEYLKRQLQHILYDVKKVAKQYTRS